MKISNFTKAALCATMLTSMSLQAEEVKDFYVQLNGGASLGLAPKGTIGSKKMGTSALYGAEVGYQIDENFRVGLGVDYRQKYSFSNISTSQQPVLGVPTEVTETAAFKVNSLVVMVNGYYDIIESNGFTPYVTLGAGIARNQLKTTVNTNVAGYTNMAVPSKNTTSFAYKLGLGTRYNLTQSVAFDVRYQFANLGKIKSGSNEILPTPLKGKLRAHEFVVGVAYKF